MSTSALPPLYGGRTAEHKLDILVVGCGLGGLAAAYALGRAGHNVTIVEGAPAIGEVGAGIQVSPNVSRVLISFGLADRLRNEAVEPLGIVFRRYDTGELLGRTDWTNMNDLYDSPYYHVHRADMHKMLSDVALSLPNVTLRLNTTVTAYTGEASIAVQPTRGDGPKETLKADLIIGADGVKSLLRSAVIGQQDQPRPTGDAAFRALVPAEKMLEHEDLKEFIEYPHMTSWMGPGRHIMGYCISGKKEYNLVLLHPDTGSVESWSQEGSADKMRAEFAGWEPRLEKLLSFVPSTLQWKLMDRLPLPTWIHPDERLVLLGDSCHPMLPYRAQGAAMAIEDGAVIGALFARLQNKEQVPTLLKAYQALRHTRTAEVQASSRLNQHIFHLEDGPEQVQRDNAMRATLAGAPGGGYPPAVIAAKANPEAYAASLAAAAPAAPGHEGNPNQWADARKSRALFGYDAERAAEEWLVANNLETVPPRAAALASTVAVTATTTAATTTGSDGEASDEDLADVQSSNGNKTLIESEAGGDAGLLAKKLGVVGTPAVDAVARVA